MSAQPEEPRRLTVSDIGRLYADGERIAMLTAYDFPTARILDDAGIPMVLVGDSLGQVALGYESTVRVTMAEMLQDGGAQAVKVEGGVRSARVVEALVKAGVPVMGHIGWTPQSQHGLGGKVKVQGKTRDAARSMLSDAIAIQEAGAFALVLELVPEQLAAVITSRLRIPTIGIGAGPHCSGQVQVITDLLGLGEFKPKHARPYADLQGTIAEATRAWLADVRAGTFPGAAETVRMDDAVLDEALGRHADDRAAGAGDPTMAGIPLDRDL
jgi:3-methyl-2-oxobutanoate hydroxymethyltransferase